jgi:hypothetical protein
MKTRSILLLICFASAVSISLPETKDQPQFNETGTLMEMQAVPCGFQERGFTGFGGLLATAGLEHVNSNDKLCQEYVLRTAYVQYRIRPVSEKEPVLLPVGEKAHFHIKGDHILLTMPEGDDKMREYRVVGMRPVATDDGSGPGTLALMGRPRRLNLSPSGQTLPTIFRAWRDARLTRLNLTRRSRPAHDRLAVVRCQTRRPQAVSPSPFPRTGWRREC